MFFFSPLEQFNLLLVLNFFNFANLHLGIQFLFFFQIFLFKFLKNFFFYESLYDLIFKNIFLFILDILIQQTHGEGIKYFPFFFSIFLFILCCNFFGLLPFSFTITAHLSITFFFALSFNLGFFFIGLIKHKFNFFLLFVPQGAPKVLLPLIIIIEIVSYLIRTFSLSIRLFANMMAGHCLLFIISSFVFTLIYLYSQFIFLFLIIIYILIFLLEFAVAFLQAYVFTILLSIYLNDGLHPVH